jgi:hypothetical protein
MRELIFFRQIDTFLTFLGCFVLVSLGGIVKIFGLLAGVLLCLPAVHAQEGLAIGADAPGFDLPTINGSRVVLGTYLKKTIVVLHFWKIP